MTHYRPKPVPFAADQVRLLAVDQDRVAGTFSWTSFAAIRLGVVDDRDTADGTQGKGSYDDHLDVQIVRLYEGRRPDRG
ncbi:hypothetical protein ACIA49_38550 [Kribbella sp. NPDC051587]|uniref:hypothetical protein n=1 Tax=Kribbella sp. NPDC051587 TaxID=3364119 RepID=UPI0037BDEB0D